MRYRFDTYELDLDTFALSRDGEVVPLQPKVLDVLRHLVERRGELVTKAELLSALWPGEEVSDAVLSWSVSHLRRALGQARGERGPIETVHRRGYRFVAEVSSAAATGSQPPRPRSPAPAPTTALVGRERLLAQLQRHVDDAIAGHGSLCLLTGEAGIGKTRCGAELLARAPALGVRALSARCPQEPDTPALWPVLSALAQQRGDAESIAARASELLQHAAQDAAQAAEGRETGADAAQGDAAPFVRIEQTAELLRELAAARPTLLVMDDLQWADAGTLRLLSFLAPVLRELPLCVVTTMREAERGAGTPNPTRLQLMRYAHTLPLAALDADEVARLFEALSGQRPSPELAEAVRGATSGVPLFVEEVVRSLSREHGREALGALAPDAVSVPELARDLLRQRIERLPPATVQVLTCAAVIGERFDLSLLAALTELEPEVLLDRLDPARVEGQLASEAPHIYRFVHALHQSVLYAQVPAAQRVALHKVVGELLEARPDAAQRRGEIARHYYLALPASGHAEALDRARGAGLAAARAYAFEDAARYYGWALEAQNFAPAGEPRARAELLASLASAQRSAGRTREALETTVRLLELAQGHHLHDLVVMAARLRRPSIAMASVPDRLLRSALEVTLQQSTDPVTRASALAQLALVPPFDPDLAHSKAQSAEALALAEPLHDRERLLEALRARLFALSGPTDIDALLQVADRMLALMRQSGGSWQGGDARPARYTACLLAARIGEADAMLDEMVASVPGPHFGEATFFCERLRATRLFLDGHFDASELRWQAAFEHASRAGVAYAAAFKSSHAMHLAVARHGPASVIAALRGLGAQGNLSVLMRAGAARLAAQAGDLELCASLAAPLGDPRELPRDAGNLNLLASLSECAAALGDQARCAQLHALLSPHAALNTPDAMGYYLGSVAHFLGLIARTLGKLDEAAAWFDQALTRNRAMGYRAGVVRTLLGRAELERLREDPTRARSYAHEAGSLAQELGMQGAGAEAQRILTSLG